MRWTSWRVEQEKVGGGNTRQLSSRGGSATAEPRQTQLCGLDCRHHGCVATLWCPPAVAFALPWLAELTGLPLRRDRGCIFGAILP